MAGSSIGCSESEFPFSKFGIVAHPVYRSQGVLLHVTQGHGRGMAGWLLWGTKAGKSRIVAEISCKLGNNLGGYARFTRRKWKAKNASHFGTAPTAATRCSKKASWPEVDGRIDGGRGDAPAVWRCSVSNPSLVLCPSPATQAVLTHRLCIVCTIRMLTTL